MADIEEPTWRNKHKIGELMKRVQDHANGTVEMTATQLRAADIFLKKTVPDLSSIQHGGDKDNPVKVDHSINILPVKPKE